MSVGSSKSSNLTYLPWIIQCCRHLESGGVQLMDDGRAHSSESLCDLSRCDLSRYRRLWWCRYFFDSAGGCSSDSGVRWRRMKWPCC